MRLAEGKVKIEASQSSVNVSIIREITMINAKMMEMVKRKMRIRIRNTTRETLIMMTKEIMTLIVFLDRRVRKDKSLSIKYPSRCSSSSSSSRIKRREDL